MQDGFRVSLPEDDKGGALDSILADGYVLQAAQSVEVTVVFYDTFDWRLFHQSLALCQIDDEWVVRRLKTGAIVERLTSESSQSFAWEFPESPFKQRIARIAGERRLLAVGKATIQTVPYRVLNPDGKTIARLLTTKAWTDPCDDVGKGDRRRSPDGAADLVDYSATLQSVRGYHKQFRRLARKLEQAGTQVSRWQETFERVITASGKRPGQYSAKPKYLLRPDMRADEAAKEVLRRTLTVIRANEEGIKADWDVEFLHDYRTAVRRTRSALGEIPDVFSPEITEHYKDAFALLGKRTNRLRDLDVYLFSEADYRAMLPDPVRDHISPLFDYMRAQREQALADVTDYLNSEAYVATMDEWATFLRAPGPDEAAAPNAALPIGELARQRIAKQYRRVIKDGNRILDSDDDELVHQLRIDCKKLRYLMEFFASLFPKKKINKLVKQLKMLQDELGEFNDLSVQQTYLLNIAEALPARDTQDKMGLVAIGLLVEKLAVEQQAMKPGLAKAFSDFAAAPNRALSRQLFGAKRGGRRHKGS